MTSFSDGWPQPIVFNRSIELYQWVGPVDEARYTFYVKADSPLRITSLEDVKKIDKIGVYRDHIREQFLTKAGFTNLERTSNNILNFKKLMAGRFDAYASSPGSMTNDAERAGFKMSDVKPAYIFLKSQIYIAVSKQTDPSIVMQWNKALDGMKSDGSFNTIFKKYFPHGELPGPTITEF